MTAVEPASELLQWYRANRRDLPWRRTRDPWAIWVAEVMLQQTRVEHVIPFFQRFLTRFPSPDALAAAPLDEALALWSGLGYYRRLRLLHRAAAEVTARGAIPHLPAALRALPGVGDYTAAAIASIAFGAAVPVLDGNVERVLCRWLGETGQLGLAATRRRLLAAAGELLVPGASGESNQAMMELGATLCLPRAPRCEACPLAPGCRARRSGDRERLPARRPRQRRLEMQLLVARVERQGRVLLFRRGEDDPLLAGTWELPWVRLEGRPSRPVVERALAARYGIGLRLGGERATVRHAITYRRLRVVVHEATLAGGETVAEGRAAGWFRREEVAALPVSSLVGKVLGASAGDTGPTDPRRRRLEDDRRRRRAAVSPAGGRRRRG
jgi:A/G-specific adenine glycosylase